MVSLDRPRALRVLLACEPPQLNKFLLQALRGTPNLDVTMTAHKPVDVIVVSDLDLGCHPPGHPRQITLVLDVAYNSLWIFSGQGQFDGPLEIIRATSLVDLLGLLRALPHTLARALSSSNQKGTAVVALPSGRGAS